MSSSVSGVGATHSVHVGRQAIYDTAGDVVAYELLFRHEPDATEAKQPDTHATTRVIVSTFTEFGVAELVGDRPCFINVTREFLVGELPLPFDVGQVALEIVPEVGDDRRVRTGVAALAEQGYTFAIDRFMQNDARQGLLEYATYVKIDFLEAGTEAGAAAIRQAVALCKSFPHVQLIAERLERPEALDLAMHLGFGLVQGHLFGRPHIVSTEALNPARLQRLALLCELAKDDVGLDRTIDLVQTDPTLALQLLKGVNAASTGLPRQVSSVAEAVVLLGSDRIRQWVTLLLVDDLAEGNASYLDEVLTCARLCQILAERNGISGQVAFTAGMLSTIVELMGHRPSDVIAGLPLTADVIDTILDDASELARIIATARSYQRGRLTPRRRIDLGRDLLSAIRWSTQQLRQLPIRA
ncbi:EAL and HDOD domain-containing protein [Dactylosporangium sp. CS-047395]|uniref:EAL and HDOD domain-containing protein n=1 Tax=Dactylosporangium sp. CS-047395 TaxID=3239936 RepID=UPI003D93B9C5